MRRNEEGQLVLRDNASSNGTLVNGEPIEETTLRPGDTIQIGDIVLSCSFEEPDLLLGKTVAGYRLEKRLGKGGMGRVYLATQLAMERVVALKILHARMSSDPQFIASFLKEAHFMAKVSHPHVVPVYDVGQDEQLFYLSMEHMEGGSLKDLIEREGGLPPARVLPLIIDATRAIIWAHQQGIVHRDIKPGNLLLTSGGRVKVSDFGIAAEVATLKKEGGGRRIPGSRHFIAPEQILLEPIDTRADIYALGCTLYNALTGKPPFSGQTTREILAQKLKGVSLHLRQAVPQASTDLESVFERMTARDPNARHASPVQLLEDLRRISAAPGMRSPVGPARTKVAPSVSARTFHRRRSRGARRPLSRSLVVPVACVLLGVGLVWWGASHWDQLQRMFPGSTPRPSTSPGDKAPEVASPGEPAIPPVPAPSPQPETLDPVASKLVEDTQLLILESRFREALTRLAAILRETPELEGLVKVETEKVLAADLLATARARALELEAAEDYAAAHRALEEVASKLRDPFRQEALQAMKSLEPKLSTGKGRGEAPQKP